MKRLVVLTIAVALFVVAGDANSQIVTTTYYQPTAVYYAPVAPAYTVASPVVVPPPAPVPTVTYYAPPAVVAQPVARVRTRYRPILGGTVSRVNYGFAPRYYPPVRY